MINSFLTPGLIKTAGLVGPGDRDYLLNTAAEAARRRAPGEQKLLRFYETGEGYEPWMDPHIASHFGVKAEDLKDSRVLNKIYRRFKGVPNKVLQGLGQEGSVPAMGPIVTALNSNYRDAILKRIESYAAQKANDFTNAANSSLNELGQYDSPEDTSTPDLSIEDPGLIEEQVSPTPPVVNTRVPISSPVVNPVLYPVDKTDYTNRLNEAQNQLSQERAAFNPGPSLPNSALTAAGGADVSFQAPAIDIPEFNAAPTPSLPNSALTAGGDLGLQAPAIDIPEFNPAPKPAPVAPAAQATQNPFYDPKSITRQQMRQYLRYTGATNMNSDMDRWKTYQAMNGNRNASNADYYSAKKNNFLGAVKNPITQPK